MKLVKKYPLHLRFIEYMPMGQTDMVSAQKYLSLQEIKKQIASQIKMVATSIKGNGPAQTFEIASGKGTIGFITPISHKFCASCNRLRLTATGKIRPCLESEQEIDLYQENQVLADAAELKSRIKKAILIKPESHHFDISEEHLNKKNMFQIGG